MRKNDPEWPSNQYGRPDRLKARARLHERFSTSSRDWHLWVFDQLDLPAEARILELGCGPGLLWARNLRRVQQGWTVICSDLSPNMVDEARRAVAAAPASFGFGVLDAQSIPFGGGTFDAVIANHMLYHVPDRARAIAEITRVLKPSGVLYAATNGVGHMREIRELAARFLPTWRYPDAAEDFGLENGANQLAPFFALVEVRLSDGTLRVTDAHAIADYLRSLVPDPDRPEIRHGLTRLLRTLERRLSAEGDIRITTSTGLFVANGGPYRGATL